MARADFPEALFGLGGQVLDKGLLKEIEDTTPLVEKELLGLVTFYYGFSTNEPLANRLSTIALQILAKNQSPQRVNKQVVSTDTILPKEQHPTLVDLLEDLVDGGDEKGEPHFKLNFAEIRWIPLNYPAEAGLLIETRTHKENKSYIIGVSPDPKNLSN